MDFMKFGGFHMKSGRFHALNPLNQINLGKKNFTSIEVRGGLCHMNSVKSAGFHLKSGGFHTKDHLPGW